MVEDGEEKQGLQTTNLRNLGFNNFRAYTCLKGFDGSLFDGTSRITTREYIRLEFCAPKLHLHENAWNLFFCPPLGRAAFLSGDGTH